jgi:hypothetical protein
VQRVVIAGHSGGGHLIAFYGNVAERGPAGCQRPEVLYPCKSEEVSNLAKPDGVILLDPSLGAFHPMSSVDPAVKGEGGQRDAALDMFAAANGYDSSTGKATYSADFTKRFYAAQAARNQRLVDDAVAKLKQIDAGKGPFKDDAPLVIPGDSDGATGVRLYHTDLRFLSHTKQPHLLLKPDGSSPEVVIQSVRSVTGPRVERTLGTLATMGVNTTVRQ